MLYAPTLVGFTTTQESYCLLVVFCNHLILIRIIPHHSIDGQKAVITFDPEIEMFRGKLLGLNGGADVYAYSVEELKKEGVESLHIFLDECRKDGVEPNKSFSGKVTTRLSPERHQALTIAAQATGMSINEMLNEGVDLVIQKHS